MTHHTQTRAWFSIYCFIFDLLFIQLILCVSVLLCVLADTSIALKSYEHRINPHRAIESVNTDILAEIREESEEVADRAESFVVDVEEEAPLGPCCKAVDTVEGPCDPGCPLQNSVYMALSWPGWFRLLLWFITFSHIVGPAFFMHVELSFRFML